ncbi:MAG TPA: glycoside hydrolase family 16 protein, partial [Roseateles sp.]
APAAAVSGTAAQTGAGTLEFNATASGWVDVHYTVNGGDARTVRMRQDGSTSRYTAGGLARGDVVEYRFTAWDNARQLAADSAAKKLLIK